MKRLFRALAVAAVGMVAATTLAATPAHASGYGVGWYGIWASSVNVRNNGGDACYNYPGPANCPTVLTTVSAPQQVYVYCQKAGETIGGNPYWVYAYANGMYGWLAGYYTDNATNWIDGVPTC
ncbi:hypothetical protein Cs7R123_13470 [Catellatospora sp. TT07R-123]|uniref:hypothetical protein n=1 Tax=Catellatospora sp. TT07R-123 TaxID=2733863 RepID=UPI001B0E7C24|nr:hypothetical protein [Catellatospora sp. TT07R-123]GHJ44005.1 hypothetical protein Cs7R123_13470 [Catellatospora sp. TT07R-123]